MYDWTLKQLIEAVGGKLLETKVVDLETGITGFSIDSRTIKSGEIFFAIKGDKFDGHEFVSEVIKKNPTAIVVSQKPDREYEEKVPFILANDTLEALQNAAQWHRNRHKARFIGVTGSNGKTTTKEMLFHLFSSKEKTFSTKGNLNNHIGMPMSILGISLDTKTAIIEMGMNHPGEIRFLAGIAKPNDALITNIGPAHIGILGSLQNIALAKSEILESLDEKGNAFLPGDDPHLPILVSKTRARVFKFGFNGSNDIFARDLKVLQNGIEMNVCFRGDSFPLKLALLGRHNALNALAALGCYISSGGSMKSAIERLETFKPVSARLEPLECNEMKVVVDCYNANPSSMREAISWLSSCSGRKVAILGDMRELGDFSSEYHTEIGKKTAESNIDILVAVGGEAQNMAKAALKAGMSDQFVHSCSDVTGAIKILRTILAPGDTVLVKASRGMHFEGICREIWPAIRLDLH
ncbi:MAG: UDP-N-acetylmuramoyl-tripeptide--D-alanyl-D-alanine ligase [Candidatus Riflebacteria bacterium]|nr:UDP-N-acetylmuramoyl-tripeptide--D-alanyl-D-alanine ligase [Candidatus Riflebacteria bacterium]